MHIYIEDVIRVVVGVLPIARGVVIRAGLQRKNTKPMYTKVECYCLAA